MKKKLPLLISLLFFFNFYAQTTYEKGYFIKNNDEKVECLIKYIYWINNPTSFKYKLLENSDKKTITIKDVKEFGINNFSKFERHTVKIEKSINNTTADLTQNRDPIFVEETLFLKTLISGAANLYSYENNRVYKFFYNGKEKNTPKQLIYKRYYHTTNTIKKNNRFHQQLSKDVKCESISNKEIQRVEYKTKQLINYFIKYNECITPGYKDLNYENNKKMTKVKLKLGASSYNLNSKMEESIAKVNEKDNFKGIGSKIGIEVELNLGFKNNNFAVIFEPTYTFFKQTKTVTPNKRPNLPQQPIYDVQLNYNIVDLPIGLKYYFSLNKDSKIFVSTMYSIIGIGNLNFNYYDTFKPKYNLKHFSFHSLNIGYNFTDKYSIELRYENSDVSTDEIYKHDFGKGYDNKMFSFILGYQLF